MGRGSEFICKTCRTRSELGYGAYSTWLDHLDSVAEFDAADSDLTRIGKNQNLRRCLVEHAGHDFLTASEDWASEYKNRDGTIDLGYDRGMVADWLIVADYGSYRVVDLAEGNQTPSGESK